MKIIRSIKQMSEIAEKIKGKGGRIGFVPTMGALHKGHLNLIHRARRENDTVVVSIFVNPIQFGPREDIKEYPRNLKQDTLLCREAGVDIIFYPDAKQMYPEGHKTHIIVEELSDCLCGKSRPGHFQGVATVVAKLFNIVGPDSAYFGQKDAQQAIIISKMVTDLDIPVKVKVMPTLRDKDGLALSSRNAYLSRRERKEALVLYRALHLARGLIAKGLRDSGKIVRRMKQLIQAKKTARIDYVSIVDLENLKTIEKIKGRCLITLAVWIGRTRLIDNIIING